MKDETDEYEYDRAITEYNASFVAPEAVKKIRESRSGEKDIEDANFAKTIESLFGRKVKFDKNGKIRSDRNELKDMKNILDMADGMMKVKKEKSNKIDITDVMNIDLE